MSQAGDRPLLLRAEEEYNLDLLSQVGGLPSIIASLACPLLRTKQMAAGALCFLTSKGCSHVKAQPDQLQPALEPLMACMSMGDQALQEHATGALANAARHASLQPHFTESNHHAALLQLVVTGSDITRANSGRALEVLAESSASSHHFSQLPVLEQLVALLSSVSTSIQLIGLRICCKLFASWPDSQHLTAVALHNAVLQFIELRGMTALRCMFQSPHTQNLAAPCLSMLALLKPSPPAFASSGTLQLLLQSLKSHEIPFDTQAAATSAAKIQQHAAKAVAALVHDSDCAAVAIQPANLKLILQLFHSAAAVIWDSALQATATLARLDDSRQEVAAFEVLDASIMMEMLCKAPGCHSLDTQSKQAQLLHKICRCESTRKVVVECGGISFLSRMLASPDKTVQQHAAGAFRRLSLDDAIAKRCWEGGIPARLVELLRSPDQVLQEYAAAALQNLACGDDDQILQLVSLGSLQLLAKLLTSASVDVSAVAAAAIKNICWDHEASRKQVADLGALRHLIAMSRSTNAEAKEAAQGCLANLALSSAVKQQIQALQT